MRYAITLNGDGTEAFREELKKMELPRNGFEKRSDGNYYKQLGDPRNISDQIKKQQLKQAEEDLKRTENRLKIEGLSSRKSQKTGVVIYECSKRMTRESFMRPFVNHAYGTFGSNFCAFGAYRLQKSYYGLIDQYSHYRKIVFNAKDDCVQMWSALNNQEEPDIILYKCISNE
jgi:hypothetical protein